MFPVVKQPSQKKVYDFFRQGFNPASTIWADQPDNEFNIYLMQEGYRWLELYYTNRSYYQALGEYDAMPQQGQELQKTGSLALAQISGGGPFTGADTVVTSFTVPSGYEALLDRFIARFTGNGIVDGTGNIAFRIKINNKYFAKNLGNMLFNYGSLDQPFVIPGAGVRLTSNQLVQGIASVPIGSPLNGGRVVMGLLGWLYPRTLATPWR